MSLKVHPLVLELTGKTEPSTGLEGKFSVYHSCAATIVHGRCGEHEYDDVVVADPEIVALRRKVRAEAREGVHEHQADVTIATMDGRELHFFVGHAVGSLERPLSDAELDGKARDLCEPVLGGPGTERFIALCRDLASAPSLDAMVKAGVPQG